jgi:hypothetical protein
MKKIWLVVLAVILAMGALGVGYAHWSKTLEIEGTAKTAVFKVGFTRILADWDVEDYNAWLRAQGLPAPEPKDVGNTVCKLVEEITEPPSVPATKVVYQRLICTITNSYPCYWGINKFTIDNAGTMPAHCTGLTMNPGAGLVISARIIGPDGNLIGWELNDAADPTKPILNVWLYKEPPDYGPGWEIQPPTEFPVEYPHSLICNQIEPCDQLLTELWVHVKQPAKQGHTYTFSIDVEYGQFNPS